MAKTKKGDPVHGWVNFHKPLGMTSTQAVGFVRRIMNAQKAGHGGTLDPLAEGVLPIALGEATKCMSFITEADKTYRFTVIFGSETNTDDREGEVVSSSDKRIEADHLRDIIPHFLGEIEQVPPAFSAIKIDGKAAYARARAGEEVEMKTRTVTVHRLELVEEGLAENLAATPQTATFECDCTKGTYVRAIARDMGRMLGVYGHVGMLARTRVGVLTLEKAVTKEKLDFDHENGHDARAHLEDIAVVLADIPAYRATHQEVRRIHAGGQLVRVQLKPGLMRVTDPNGKVVSLVDVGRAGEMRVVRNLNV